MQVSTPSNPIAHQVEGRLGNATYRDPSAGRMRFAEVAETWLAAQSHLKRSSRTSYREALETHVLPRWSSTPIDQIRHEDVAAWIGKLLVDPGPTGKPLGASRTRVKHSVLSMVHGWAVTNGRLAVNPAFGVKLPRRPPTSHVYLGHAQVEVLAQAAGLYRPLILLLAYTGLRWGEVSALKVGRVDLDARRVQIVEAYGDDDGELYLDTPKDHERRAVPLTPFLVDELKPLVVSRDPDELVFPAPRKGPLRYHNFRNRAFDKAVEEAGIKKITPHKLRHTAASLAIAAGADVKVIQTMLGHATATETLNTYGHLWPDRLDEVSTALDAGRKAALKTVEPKTQQTKKAA
ncbi:MAG: site-specific integrase [Longispora sp.]|nr:site-specific integrase [Longispora sp. (in: high G+C Gram-positive bacteria)]